MVRGRTPEMVAGADAASRLRRSIRRGLAVVTATALAMVALPMAVAAAAPSAGAALLAGQDVFPGTFTYQITVTNNRTVLNQTGGEAINYVDILLPSTVGIKTNGAATPPPGGWTARTTNLSGLQTYTFRGGSIAPGGFLTFNVPASVAAPSADRSGAFEVAVSSDDGVTTSGAGGALTTTIRTLRVLPAALGATSPAGVVDQSGTAGQAISYTMKVKNFAKGSQNVTSALSSSGGSDSITQAPTQTLVSGAIGTFVSQVTLAGTSDRTATFIASAKAPTGTTGSQAQDVARTFEVQAPAALTVPASSFDPKFSTGVNSETWSLGVTKVNKPKLTLSAGSLTLPVNVAAGLIGSPISLADGTPRTLSFGPAQVKASDGQYSVDYTFTGTDDNGFAYSADQLKGTLTNVLTIDSLRPVIKDLAANLPLDADGRRQTAASNDGDVISVSGKIEDNSAIADCKKALQYVRLTSDKGVVIPVSNATATAAGPKACTFSGSVTTAKSPATFPADTLSFKAEAGAVDDTGTPGDASTPSVPVDLVAPVFAYAETMGTGTKADRILVSFDDAGTVFGACNPTQWKIDSEVAVTEVQYSDGSKCVAGQAGPASAPTNDRILVLNAPRDQDLQTNVTYTPGSRPVADRATDRAGQDALSKVVATVIGVAPAAPVITTATRTDADGKRQTATFDEGRFFTNRTGNDLLVEFTGARAGYFVQVFDQDGRALGAATDATTGLVTVPVGTTDDTYSRSIALINTRGLMSAKTGLLVVLDRVAPQLGAVSRAGTNSVTVKFSEKLASGSNFAEDWFVFENNADQDPDDPDDDRAYYQVSSVSGTGDSRTVNTNRALADIGPVGAEYVQRAPSGTRYVDRAGNALANTV